MDFDTALNVINKERPEYGWDTADGFLNNSVIQKYTDAIGYYRNRKRFPHP